MYKIGENEMVLCPYNRAHVVSKLRIQKHIIKCSSQYPEIKLVSCFYNFTHRLKPEEVLKHYEICTHKTRMEEARYCGNNEGLSCGSFLASDKSVCYPDIERPSYLTKTNSVKNSIRSAGSQISVTSNLGFKSTTKTSMVTDAVDKIQSPDCDVNENDDVDDLKPLSLPKTVSKAFTCMKQATEKLSDKVQSSDITPQSKFSQTGFGRGKNFVVRPSKPPRTNDHLLPDVSDMNKNLAIKDAPKYFLKKTSVLDVGNSCSASVISSLFDDGTTLKSDDLTFDDEDHSDGFIFKNFDKYVKIDDLND